LVPYTTSTASSLVLPESIAQSLLTQYGTGSGPFNAPVLLDYFGAVAGIPYTDQFAVLNRNYDALSSVIGLPAKMSDLDQAVLTYINSFVYDSPDPDITPVDTAVSAVLTSLNSAADLYSTTAWYTICDKLAIEVSNLSRAGVTFNSGFSLALKGFAQRLSSLATSSSTDGSVEFFANITTNDMYGDTIRLVFAETQNKQKLGARGITLNADPNSRLLLNQSQQKNIPLSTYISQNK
jgi:hypothetical protein